MLSETTATAALLAYADRIAQAEHDLLVAEVLRPALPPRVRVGAALVHLGTRLMAPARPAALPWRTVQVWR